MKKLNLLIYLFIICSFTVAKTQDISLKEINASVNDSIVLRFNDYTGDAIQWQASTDSIDWADITNANADTLLIVVEQQNYIRALVTVSACEPFVSDIAKVNIKADLGQVSDVDGNVYKTIVIGEQEWMAENLSVTKFNDGVNIPMITDTITWNTLSTPAYCWYSNDLEYKNLYGALYNWYTVKSGKLCPTGWHVPTKEEWDVLIEFLIVNGYNYDGTIVGHKNAKSIATQMGWTPSDDIGDVGNDMLTNNKSGFSALPSGLRVTNENAFSEEGESAWWWTSSSRGASSAYHKFITYRDAAIFEYGQLSRGTGHSVRCLKGEGNLVPNKPPNIPNSYSPENNATNQPLSDSLIWSFSDPDGDILTYDVYFDSIDATTLVSENQTDTIYLFEDLQINTTYYWKIVAKDGYGHVTEGEVWRFTTVADTSTTGTVTDIDGNMYKTVKIGEQWWMAENLKVTQDAQGNDINRYCFNDETTNCELYGGLYTWNTIMNGSESSISNPSEVQGVCPTGWHVPSETEWVELENHLISLGYPNSNLQNGNGNVLKSCRQVSSPLGGDCSTSEHPRWDPSDDHYGIDSFGFAAYPGGYRSYGVYTSFGIQSYWWSSTAGGSTSANYRSLSLGYGGINHGSRHRENGAHSLRCVKD